MDAHAIVDTGFLVALLNKADRHHAWAVGLVPDLRGPWLTTESCISESVFLLERAGSPAVEALFDWMARRILISCHFLPEELDPVREESFRYNKRWVDFADACLVVLSDRHPKLPLATVDLNDFSVYFRGRKGRTLITPSTQ
jgi:predicted nucleic acid-binding protein